MAVDSFRYLPRSFRGEYETVTGAPNEPVWADPPEDVSRAKVALLTSAGVYLPATQAPFDLDRERSDPFWGDPTYREIPTEVTQEEIGVAHLHINTEPTLADVNVSLPIRPFTRLAADGVIGGLTDVHYSFMGYQAPGNEEWLTRFGPELAGRLRDAGADALILAPA